MRYVEILSVMPICGDEILHMIEHDWQQDQLHSHTSGLSGRLDVSWSNRRGQGSPGILSHHKIPHLVRHQEFR